jgi:hypothetical protein
LIIDLRFLIGPKGCGKLYGGAMPGKSRRALAVSALQGDPNRNHFLRDFAAKKS